MTATGPGHLIKAQIKANLDALVSASAGIGCVLVQDINTDILQTEFPAYPCAILGTGTMEAEWEYQQTNRRTYVFNILIVQLQDNLTGLYDMEDLRDMLATRFDENFTLAGTAPFGVTAVFSERAIVKSGDKNFVLFNVTIRARTPVGLTYS